LAWLSVVETNLDSQPRRTTRDKYLKAVRFFAPRVPLPQHAAETRSFSAAVFFKPRWAALLSSSEIRHRLETKLKKGSD
jgi:hypothetical protein